MPHGFAASKENGNDVVATRPFLLVPQQRRAANCAQNPSCPNDARWFLVSSAPTNQPFVFRPAVLPAGAAGGSPGAVVGSQDSLVNDTRREIAEITREIAIAARSDRTIGQFCSLLVDRVIRAMAAEGVVVWYRDSNETEAPFEAIQRCGRVTDLTIPNECDATHQTMLAEVAREAVPVVVPATPGASEPSVPANPTSVPAAVVPVHSDASPDNICYLIEVFLEPEAGVTTQRGYLRFVVQMADLAGEFFRTAELRRLQRSTSIGQRVDTAVDQLHRSTRREQVQAAIVDTAADLFQFDRVALCLFDAPHATLAAVSHVNQIDQRSDGARYLKSAAKSELSDGIAILSDDTDDSPHTLVIAPHDQESNLRLVAISETDLPIEDTHQLRRFVDQAAVSLRNASQFDSIPGGRLLASLAPTLQTGQVQWWLRPIFTACVLTMLIIIAMVPVPMYVHSTSTIRPADVQRLTAPRDATVQQLHVVHGQPVMQGDPLVTLVDDDLDGKINELMGQRDVLTEELSRRKKLRGASTSIDRDSSFQLESDQIYTKLNIDNIDRKLKDLRKIKESLVIRADRSGSVDGWRMRERLDGRPLMRGDPLMRVIATESPWVVDALVPQNRIEHLREALDDQSLNVHVALESAPQRRWTATVKDIGPSVVQPDTGVRLSSVRLQLTDSMIGTLLRSQAMNTESQTPTVMAENKNMITATGAWASDAPAKTMFHCGRRPAAYLLFQDVIAAVRSSAGLYLGGTNEKTN